MDVEHGIHIGCPAGSFAIINKTPHTRRVVDRLAQSRSKRLVIGVHHRGGVVELAEQRSVLLRHIHDHFDESIDTLLFQMIANPRKRVMAVGSRVVRRQCGGHQVLAESPVSVRGA